MFTDSHERLALCAYWICVIYVSVRRFYSISKQSKTERILLRKYYHLVAVLIFPSAVIFQVVCAYLGLIFISPKTRFNFHQNIKYFGLENCLYFAACFLGLGIWCSICSFLGIGDDTSKRPILLSSQVIFTHLIWVTRPSFAPTKCLTMPQIWEIYPLGHLVHQFMNAFTDHRDSEILIVR